jgi:hypothetical protein
MAITVLLEHNVERWYTTIFTPAVNAGRKVQRAAG